MNKTLLASIAIAFSSLASANVPSGSETPSQVEAWVDTTASGATSGPEAGFANLFAQADDSPRALPVRGERDPVEAMITHTLLAQRLTATLYAAR
jgi:hypothetical protein